MQDLPQRVTETPSALTRTATYLFILIALLALVPLLLLFVLVLYLLAFVQGARVFVFSSRSNPPEPGGDLQPPHFLEMQPAPKALPDETPKG